MIKLVRTKIIIFPLLILLICSCSVKSPPLKTFTTPAQAIEELELAVSQYDKDKATKLFGPETEYFLYSGDSELDKQRAEKFSQLFNQHHELKADPEGKTYTLILGNINWPFPIPLVSGSDGWYFDFKEGKQAVLDRVIGFNEISAMNICQKIYFAQKAYKDLDLNHDGVSNFARQIVSSPGQRDGLYWPAADSPLSGLIAGSAYEAYTTEDTGEPKPYKGYYFRIITEQVVPDKYWLVAYPAVWGNSGIMSFAMNERGWIYQKDFAHDYELPKNFTVADIQLTDRVGWERIQ